MNQLGKTAACKPTCVRFISLSYSVLYSLDGHVIKYFRLLVRTGKVSGLPFFIFPPFSFARFPDDGVPKTLEGGPNFIKSLRYEYDIWHFLTSIPARYCHFIDVITYTQKTLLCSEPLYSPNNSVSTVIL